MSGTVLNVVEVIPVLLMNVVPTRITFTPYPCRTTSRLGNASPPWLTKYTGPASGSGMFGTTALALPITDGPGHAAGFASNCAFVQAFCSVVNRDGSCFGSSTLTLAISA